MVTERKRSFRKIDVGTTHRERNWQLTQVGVEVSYKEHLLLPRRERKKRQNTREKSNRAQKA